MLAHAHEDCVGSWRLDEAVVVCHECGKVHDSTNEIRAAAMSENFAGRMLQLATTRGSALLHKERR